MTLPIHKNTIWRNYGVEISEEVILNKGDQFKSGIEYGANNSNQIS